MSINIAIKNELRQLIDGCKEYEGRYYLLYLYESLVHSEKSSELIDRTAMHLITLIKNINELKNSNTSFPERLRAADKIAQNYKILVAETGARGVFYKSKQALLDLGGLIIGIIAGAFGSVLGSLSLGISDLIHFKLPTGVFVGAFTGLIVGFTVGKRAPHKLFKEEETRLIQHTVNKLKTTFESLFTSVKANYLDEVTEEVLQEYFNGDTEAFNAFLKKPQKYEILGTEVALFSNKLKGSLGHHSFIKFTINNQNNAKLIEIGLPSTNETVFSQQETRETTGEQLLNMLAMHRLLQPQYELSFRNFYGFYKRYQAGINDCQTYVDKILTAVGEPVSQLKRFTPKDTFWGRFIGNTVNFFRPAPEKVDEHILGNDCTQDNNCSKINCL